MSWAVEIAEEFASEFYGLEDEVQDAILATSRLLQQFGPQWDVRAWIRSTACDTRT
jgi:hypothetical protein